MNGSEEMDVSGSTIDNDSMHLIETSSDDAFVKKAAGILTEKIETAIADHDFCILGLSGGSTPRSAYAELGRRDLDWSKVRAFLVDERYVDRSDENANQKLARDTLPKVTFIFPDTSLPIEKCVRSYTADLQEMWDERLPDIVILGMGEDGHIASLFPPVSDDALSDRGLVFHTTTAAFVVHDRITVSLNAIAAAQSHLVLLKGGEKKRVWEEMQSSDEDEHRWPLKRVLETGTDVTVITQWSGAEAPTPDPERAKRAEG